MLYVSIGTLFVSTIVASAGISTVDVVLFSQVRTAVVAARNETERDLTFVYTNRL